MRDLVDLGSWGAPDDEIALGSTRARGRRVGDAPAPPRAKREPSRSTGTWTDERVKALTALWIEGLSCSKIAKELGGITRNAVIGKVHRLGLDGRATPSAPHARPVERIRRMPPSHQRWIEFVSPGASPGAPERRCAAIAADPLPVSAVIDLKDHQCKWPIDGEAGAPPRFCGAKRVRGAYCEAHAQRAYVAPKKRRPSAKDPATAALDAIAAARRANWWAA